MPRDQETSFGRNLFRKRDDEPGDQSVEDHGDPLRDPFGADENTARSDTPIGDEVSVGRHAGPDGNPSDTPGEWVAGPNGPATADAVDDGPVVPEQAGRPAAESTDPVTGDPVANGTASRDPLGGDTAVQDDTAARDRAVTDPDAPETTSATPVDDTTGTGATDATSATGAAPDLRATRDPEVAPDTQVTGDTVATSDVDAASATDVAPGGEVTPDTGFPVQNAAATSATTDTPAATGASMAADAPATTDTPVTADTATAIDAPNDAAAAAATTGTPVAPVTTEPAPTGTPVPGAPGTGSTTGVEAASASLVTNGAQLHDDWARIQSSFVDDPQGSVSQAADLVAQVTGSLVSAVQERERTLRSEWDGRSDSDTENLRNALRDYRAFFELLIKL